MSLQKIREKVAKEMGYTTWDNLVSTCCLSNTPHVIFQAETRVNELNEEAVIHSFFENLRMLNGLIDLLVTDIRTKRWNVM